MAAVLLITGYPFPLYFHSNFYFTAPENIAGLPVLPTLATLLTSTEGAAEALQQVTRDGGTYTICMTKDDFEFFVSIAGERLTEYTEMEILSFWLNLWFPPQCTSTHWEPRVDLVPNLLSLVAPQVVILTMLQWHQWRQSWATWQL